MEESYMATTRNGHELKDLRDSYDLRDKTKELEEKSIRRKKLMYLHGFGSSATSDVTNISSEDAARLYFLLRSKRSYRWLWKRSESPNRWSLTNTSLPSTGYLNKVN